MNKNINFLDPYIKIKSEKTNKNFQLIPDTDIPLPSEIEISESGTCTNFFQKDTSQSGK